MTKKLTPIQAIRAKCRECSCFQKEDVIHCPVKTCALWPYRIKLELMDNIELDVDPIEKINSISNEIPIEE